MEIFYKTLGFRCGIEIHQQLDTHKLFCNCPSIVRDDNPDISVVRKLNASAGETGEYDKAALHEMLKDRTFTYEACSTSACLVELDEEPPGKVNSEALSIALEICLLLKAKIVDELIFMRKVVVDGSNVSGFQRTGLIATDGQIETSKGIVKIPTILLEEEAAKNIGGGKKFRLDRLGIPLVEIATDDSIQDAMHAKEAAEKIGMILRSTGKVMRGIGTIRQDVNISIKKGSRVEVKGFQDLKSIPKVIDFEINRQSSIIKQNKQVKEEVRKAESDFTTSFLRPLPGAARLYPETDVVPIKITSEMLSTIKLPELISDKLSKLGKKYSLREDIVNKLIKTGKIELFENLINFKNLKSGFIADWLLANDFQEGVVLEVFGALNAGKIGKGSLEAIFDDVSSGKGFVVSKYKMAGVKNLEGEIKKIVDANKGKNVGALMGMIMAKYKGKVDGKKVMEILKKMV